MTKRLTNLPQPTSLDALAETCERHARNITMNLLDCADCQDCSDSELAIYRTQQAQWLELAGDIRAMIVKRNEGKPSGRLPRPTRPAPPMPYVKPYAKKEEE